MPRPTTLIVEMSGDEDRSEDRYQALEIFAHKHSDISFCVILKEGRCDRLFLTKEGKLTQRVVHHRCRIPYQHACELLSDIEDAVLISAGDTTKLVTQAVKRVGLINPQVPPVLAAVFPKIKGEFIVTDVGGSLKLDEAGFLWTAFAATQVAKVLFGKEEIKVGLLNIGEEAGKGNAELVQIRRALELSPNHHFVGNIEFHSVVASKPDIDVLLTSGELGNHLLKISEGLIALVFGKLSSAMSSYAVNESGWTTVRQTLSWQQYSGAYLLGVKKPIIITHGRSDEKAFFIALERACMPQTLEIWKRLTTTAGGELGWHHRVS